MHSKRNTLMTVFTCALVLCSVGTLRDATAASSTTADGDLNRTFATRLINLEHPSGAFDGTLRLTIGRSGSVVGYYRSVDSMEFVAVTGGVTGDKIHLEIGALPPINGLYRDGTIVGFAFIANYTHRFTAVGTDRPQT